MSEQAILRAERELVVLRLRGTIGDEAVSGRMRHTRTWSRDGGAWRVLGALIAPAAP
jgi:hypothetical protein